jgi:single-stranded-DNA-specific exonuclease
VVPRGNIEGFRNHFNHLAREKLTVEDILPSIDVDAEASLRDLDISIVREMGALEPFGAANPAPLF